MGKREALDLAAYFFGGYERPFLVGVLEDHQKLLAAEAGGKVIGADG